MNNLNKNLKNISYLMMKNYYKIYKKLKNI